MGRHGKEGEEGTGRNGKKGEGMGRNIISWELPHMALIELALESEMGPPPPPKKKKKNNTKKK